MNELSELTSNKKYAFVIDAPNAITLHDKETKRWVQVVVNSPYCEYKFMAINDRGRIIMDSNLIGNIRQSIFYYFEHGSNGMSARFKPQGYIQGF